VGYKVDVEKSISFLYISNEEMKFEIENAIPFTLALKMVKYCSIPTLKKR
jgi:hypothetical protein